MDIEDLKKELIKTKQKIFDDITTENLGYYIERVIVLESLISSHQKHKTKTVEQNHGT